MFHNAIAFNQPLGAWDLRRVTTVKDMFRGAKAFKQSLASWDLDHVKDKDSIFG